MRRVSKMKQESWTLEEIDKSLLGNEKEIKELKLLGEEAYAAYRSNRTLESKR